MNVSVSLPYGGIIGKKCNCYVTRYMTQTNFRHLFKNKGYLVYNYKLKKYEHLNKTPLHQEYKSMQQFKNEFFFKNALSQKA